MAKTLGNRFDLTEDAHLLSNTVLDYSIIQGEDYRSGFFLLGDWRNCTFVGQIRKDDNAESELIATFTFGTPHLAVQVAYVTATGVPTKGSNLRKNGVEVGSVIEILTVEGATSGTLVLTSLTEPIADGDTLTTSAGFSAIADGSSTPANYTLIPISIPYTTTLLMPASKDVRIDDPEKKKFEARHYYDIFVDSAGIDRELYAWGSVQVKRSGTRV
jgi:hypothetical protein